MSRCLSPLLLLLQQTAFSRIGGKDGAVERALAGNIDGRVLATAAQDGTARNPFFKDALQLFGQLELLRGMTLHA